MTLSDLIAAIKSYSNRTDLSDDDVTLWLRSVNGQLNRLLLPHARMLRRAVFTQIAGNDFMSLPNDVLQIKTLRANDVVWTQIQSIDSSDPPDYSFLDRGQTLQIFPTPEEDTQFTLDYYGAVEELNAGVIETNWVSRYFPDVYIYGGLVECAVWTRDNASLPAWKAEFEQRVGALKAQGWGQNLASPPKIHYG